MQQGSVSDGPAVWAIICGLYNLGFGVFHLTFWRLLRWKEQLPRLSPNNAAVMQVLNLCLTWMFFVAGYIYLVHAGELAAPGPGRTLALGVWLLWVGRAVTQVAFMDMRRRVHQALLAIFVAGALVHGAALWG